MKKILILLVVAGVIGFVVFKFVLPAVSGGGGPSLPSLPNLSGAGNAISGAASSIGSRVPNVSAPSGGGPGLDIGGMLQGGQNSVTSFTSGFRLSSTNLVISLLVFWGVMQLTKKREDLGKLAIPFICAVISYVFVGPMIIAQTGPWGSSDTPDFSRLQGLLGVVGWLQTLITGILLYIFYSKLGGKKFFKDIWDKIFGSIFEMIIIFMGLSFVTLILFGGEATKNISLGTIFAWAGGQVQAMGPLFSSIFGIFGR